MMSSIIQLTNATIFTESDWKNGSVTITDGVITSIDFDNIQARNNAIDCGGNLLVPGLLDLQIYGAGGRLFSAYPDVESLRVLAEENYKAGTIGCLATIATQPLDIIYKSIEAIQQYWQQGGTGILGMHLEGPYMNPVKRGAHKEEWMRIPTVEEVEALLNFAKGAIKMITIAPERCPADIIQMLVNAGIIVSAGHSNATYEQAMRFPEQGIYTITHLFNAMTPLHHRDTGIPGAAFENRLLRAAIIPDGIHVNFSALRIAKKQIGERLYFITDAVTETSEGPYKHTFKGDHYAIPEGTLSGSAISLLQGIHNAVKYADISLEESLRMASLYPAKIMNLQNEYGSIAVGKKAGLLLLDKELNLLKMIG